MNMRSFITIVNETRLVWNSGKDWYNSQRSQAVGGKIAIYRGEYSGNKGGKFWTTDPEFARQFTQSGLDREIMTRKIYLSDIYLGSADVYAGDPDAIDAEIAKVRAEEDDYKAVLLDEGPDQPKSIYVFDWSALTR